MPTYPKYDFSDPTLNYSDVEATVMEMYSYLNAQHGCCKPRKIQDALCEVDSIQFITPYDEDNNTDRWELDVKTSYLILYPLASS